MEVHAPHAPILSKKDALVHLAIVTVGIIIALSFDGMREWLVHRAQVAEAHENLTNEIRDNKKELEGFLATVGGMKKDFESAFDAAQTLLDGKPLQLSSLRMGFNFPSLTSASLTTAEVTGAFGLMRYEDVKKYELTYSLQGQLERLQSDAITRLLSTIAGMALVVGGKATTRELEDWRANLTLVIASLQVQEQIATQLNTRYASQLAGR